MVVLLNRREVLKGALGVFATWTSSRVLGAQQAFGGARRLTDQMAVVDGGGSNVLAFSSGEGCVLVDGGAPKSFDKRNWRFQCRFPARLCSWPWW